MVGRSSRFLGALFLLLFTQSAQAAEAGMFLCRSPLIAHSFWDDLIAAKQLGIDVNLSIFRQVAKKDECLWVESDHLSPIRAGWAGMLALTDGNVVGWATPEYYVLYTNRPK